MNQFFTPASPMLKANREIKRDEEKAPPYFIDGEAELFVKRRVCARCYSDLEMRPHPDEWGCREVYCYYCGSAWGYTTVSRFYAEHLGQEAILARAEAKKRFADLIPNPHKGKSEKTLLNELGY